MSDEITIRRPETPAEYAALQDAQRLAWGISRDGYVVPVATMVGAQLHGGLVLGAYDAQGKAVGLSFGFLGRSDGVLCLYSQLTGVVPGHQGSGLGHRLKQAQWEFARDQGLPLVAWAFDPLQAGNANFNLGRLGATCHRYVENMYGLRTDTLNLGAPTDRLIAEWPTAPHQPLPLTDAEAATTARLIAGDGQPRLNEAALDADRALLEIPEDIGALRQAAPERAAAWQATVRAAFQAAFARHFRAVGFYRDAGQAPRRCSYILTRS